MHATYSALSTDSFITLEVEREGIVGGREVLLGDMDKLWKLVAFMIAVIAPRSGGGENTMFWYACMHMAPIQQTQSAAACKDENCTT